MPGGFHPPVSVVLTWPLPNYDDPVGKGHQLLVVTIIFGVLAVIFVSARLWSRIKVQKNAGLDDLFITLALVPTIGLTALFILISTKFRWFRHIWDVPLSDISGRQYQSWVAQLLFVISTFFSKISTLLLYRRVIAGSPDRLSINIVNSAIVTMNVYFIVFVLLMVFQCTPTDAYWLQYSFPDIYTTKYSCMFEGKVPIANAIISVTTDFLIGLLPVYLFKDLRVPVREKIALGVLFGVGFLVCIMGIIRTVLVHHIFYETYDVSWYSHEVWIWTNIENDLLIVCSSVPPLRALFKRFFHSNTTESSFGNSNLARPGGSYGWRDNRENTTEDGMGDRAIELYDSDYTNTATIHSNALQTPSQDNSSSLKSKTSREYSGNGVIREVSVMVDYYKRADTFHKMV